MRIMRWTPTLAPVREAATVQDEVNRLFDTFLTREPTRARNGSLFAPPVDVEETAEGYVFRADLPGIDPKAVKVSIAGDVLTLSGERKRDNENKQGSLHRTERVYGAFERSFTLGVPVKTDQVKAAYRDGVLEVRVPKAEDARVREIEVQVG